MSRSHLAAAIKSAVIAVALLLLLSGTAGAEVDSLHVESGGRVLWTADTGG
jgi:hypothetical protein